MTLRVGKKKDMVVPDCSLLDCSPWGKPAAMLGGHSSSPLEYPQSGEPRPPVESQHWSARDVPEPPVLVKPSDAWDPHETSQARITPKNHPLVNS